MRRRFFKGQAAIRGERGERQQTAAPTYEPQDFSQEAIDARAEQAAADPEQFYSDLIRDQFDDWLNRFLPVQQEAIDIAMGNDRERRAIELAQQQYGTQGTYESALNDAIKNLTDSPDRSSLSAFYKVALNPNDYKTQSQLRDTGFRLLAGEERQEVDDTTRRAFDIGENVSDRNRQRYGLNIGQSATQDRGRDVNQALATVGGVNSMRDGLRDRQDYLMTGSNSAMSGIFNKMAG